MLLDCVKRGSEVMIHGFIKSLWDTGKGNVANTLIGDTNPTAVTPYDALQESIATHKENWAKTILNIPHFDYALRGRTDISSLYIPLYLVHNKEDQAHLDAAEIKSERLIPTDMIFSDFDGTPAPNTILIEGVPGTGKTTFAKAYMYDWCKSSNITGNLGWRLILYVSVTKIVSNVEDAVKSAIAVTQQERPALYQLLGISPALCVVIFDGIDECRDENIRKQLETYIEASKMGQKPKVIVTARTYLCGLDAGLFHRHLKCDGFSASQTIEYIEKFFRHDKAKAEEIKQKVAATTQFLTNPLKLYMMCMGIHQGLIDISSCDKLSSKSLFLSQEGFLLRRELAKRHCTRKPEQIDGEMRNFTMLTLGAMLLGERSLTHEMLHQADIPVDSVVTVFLEKEYLFTISGEVDQWTYLHETLFEFLSARGLCYLEGDNLICVLLYICARREFRNLMALSIGLLDQWDKLPSTASAAKIIDKDELIEDMFKVCLLLQGLLDKKGISEDDKVELKVIKSQIDEVVNRQSTKSLIKTLCLPSKPLLSDTQVKHKNELVRYWRLVINTFYGTVMKNPEEVFFDMMEEERYCGIINHIMTCIHESQKSELNIIHWVIPGHWCDVDGHGSLLEKDVYKVGDQRWVMVSYGIWQHGRARVFDAWCPDDAVFAWNEHQKGSHELQQKRKLLQKQKEIHEHFQTRETDDTTLAPFQSIEFRVPSPRESFRVWGTKGQAPPQCFSREPWRRFFNTVILETREFHLYLAAETPLLPVLEVVIEFLDRLKVSILMEMEIWGGHITMPHLQRWVSQYRNCASFELLQLRGIDVVCEEEVSSVIQQFKSEPVIDHQTMYFKRPLKIS